MNPIYMDNAATSWPKPESVYGAMDRFNRQMGANPGRGSNLKSLEAGMVVFETREALASFFGVEDSARIAFTANITMSLNIVLKGLLSPGDHVLISGMEHNAVSRPLFTLAEQGVEVTVIPCAPDGTADPADFEKHIRANTRAVCMLHASNVTGTIMPIEKIGAICRNAGLLFVVDAAQSAGVLPIDVQQIEIDALCFTGHKGLLGPQGTGGFYIRPGLEIRSLLEGGTGSFSESTRQPELMPDKFESGTLNTPGIAGLGAGIRFIEETGLARIRQHEITLTKRLMDGLSEISDLRLYGAADPSARTAVVSFNIGKMDCGQISLLLDQEYGITNRSGLHCAPLAHQTLGTLDRGACRLSPGFFNTAEDVDRAIQAVHAIAKNAR